jgi:predicted dehydrogenase
MIAIQALQAGCHCLIEKPLSTSYRLTKEIIALSYEAGLTVQIGHQERLVLRAIGLDVVEEKPLKIEAVRNGPYSARGTDTSVTMDLMTHDIDLCTALMGGGPTALKGEAGSVRSETADMAYAVLRYGETTARLSASRVADVAERWMKLTYVSGDVLIDFNAKILANTTSFELNDAFADAEIAKDSLGAATDLFVRAVLDGTPVLVSAEDGAIAMSVALLIDTGREIK